jgi:aryl-alcohol dehydrogenase-like predicted oxidoreductase
VTDTAQAPIPLPGLATPAGTARYVDRQIKSRSPEHFRKPAAAGGRYFSSLGIGTYLGPDDDATDAGYTAAVLGALQGGINVIDTASNYRNQRSERAVGAALRKAAASGVARDEVIVASKAGFIPFDGAMPEDPRRYVEETYLKPGLFTPEEIVGGCHAMTPKFLDFQFTRSLENLGLAAIDIYFLHNIEMQRAAVGAGEFGRRLRLACERMERQVQDGRLALYGLATWDGLRAAPGDPGFLDLDEILAAAREVGGAGHHLRAFELPYNLAMTEAFAFANQAATGPGGPATFLERAQEAGLVIFTSASMLQGKFSRGVPPEVARAFPELKSDAQRALQFARSTPGVTTALCGMSKLRHVQENLQLAVGAPRPAALRALYSAAR